MRGRSAGRSPDSRRLRVVVATPRYPPYRGGVETHTSELARRLVADHGFEVEVITTDLEGSLPPSEVIDGVKVERVPAWPRGRDLYLAPGVASRIARSGADLVHVQGYHTAVPPVAMLAAIRARLPYVVTLHSGGHSSSLRHRLRSLQVRALAPLMRRAKRIVAVSPFEAQLFAGWLHLPPQRFAVIPSGSDLPIASAQLPTRDPNLIVSVGRLERYKGHDRVLAALALVRDVRRDARLLILGDGPDADRLRSTAGDLGLAQSVAIRGVPREEVAGELAAASVAVLLSAYESQGLGAYEALALGCRLVVGDGSALGELRDVDGVRVVPADAGGAEVAAVVLAQLDAAGTPLVPPSLPAWDETAARTARLYRSVLGRAGHRG